MNRRGVAILLLLAVAFVAAFFWMSSERTPAGQPALLSLGPGNLADFEHVFDGARRNPRLLVLVSPT